MNGLLNNYQPDPVAQSLLGFAGGLLTPVSRGGGFGAGLLGASQGMSQARQEVMQIEQMKRQMAQDELRKRLIEAQVKETENQAAERMLKVEQDKRKQEATSRFQSMLTGQDAQIPQGFDMRSASSQQSNFPQAQLNNPAMVMAALNAGMTPEQIKLLAESGNLGRAKVARTIETANSQGQPTTVMVDDYGTTVGGAMPKAYQRERVSQGDRISFVDPYTNSVSGSLQMFQSPDSKASNAVAWANNALAKQRLAMDMSDPKLQYDADRGVLVNQRTGQAQPVMQGSQPLGPKDKQPTEFEAKAGIYFTSMDQASKALEAIERKGTSAVGTAERVGAMLPGDVGRDISNYWAGKDRQAYTQAQRQWIDSINRIRSGAALPEIEYDRAVRTFFPTYGETNAQIEQKRQARFMEEQAIRNAGTRVKNIPELRPQPGTSGATGGWSIEKQ